MSSDEEYNNDYDIEKDCQETFHTTREEAFYQNLEDHDDDEGRNNEINKYNVERYDKNVNKKVKENNLEKIEVEIDESNQLLDDFIGLLEDQDEPKEVVLEEESKKKTEIPIKKINDDSIDGILIEKHTGIRLIKSPYSSDGELNMRVDDYGQYFKLTELIFRRDYIEKNKSSLEWFTIAVIGSKSESKCSAKGNNYIIWNLYDLNNLEKEQEISLFLFGQSYKSHWKTSEFQTVLILKPQFLDDAKNENKSKNQFAHKPSTNKPGNKKISLSVINENQLIALGTSKDITVCQSYKKTQVGSNEHNTEGSQRCKNLVNLCLSKFCIYHCKKLDKSFKSEKFDAAKKSQFGNNKSSFNNFEPKKYNANEGIQVYNPKINLNNIPIKSKYKMENVSSNETANKNFVENPESNSSILIKKIKNDKQLLKETTILSLTYNQHESPILSNLTYKSTKASDKEVLAKLLNENIDEKEIKTIRKAAAQEQQTTQYSYSNESKQVNKEIKNLFSSKVLLPNETNCNNSISAKKLVELKNSSYKFEVSKDDKKSQNLAAKSSHRDIMKQIKKNNDISSLEKEGKETEVKDVKPDEKRLFFQNNKPTIKAFDFLKDRISDISNTKKLSQSPATKSVQKPRAIDEFELDIYIGQEKTFKKLMDSSPGQKALSPKINTQSPLNVENKKRKLSEIQSPNSNNLISEKDKKRKLIDDLINIKSRFSKDANDPEKNAHLKSYLTRLEEKESVENHLSSIKRKEVRVVTCKICSYTSFGPSDFCKFKRHEITRHSAIQRYFKCKSCNKRTFTLDKICPTSACIQCGSEKFEPCGMKNEAIETSLISNEIVMD